MRHTKKPGELGQKALFDTENCGWWHTQMSPEALRRIEGGIEGYFRRSILAQMPVERIGEAFDPEEGRLSKELHAMCGLLLLAEFYGWTVDQTADAWCFNNAVHYALNLAPKGQYLCPRTVDHYRRLLREDGLAQEVFERITAGIVVDLQLNIKKQRLDSTHILSHMAQLGRLRLLAVATKRFLVQLKRHHPAEYEALPEDLKKRYESAEGRLFGEGGKRPETRESAIQQAAEDMAGILARFGENGAIATRSSFGALARIFGEHCEVTMSDKIEVLEKAEDANGQSARVLQNPSDAGAGYDGHKGPGYQVQIAQACDHGEDAPGIITACLVQSAAESDAAAPRAIIEQQERMGTRAQKLLADTLYGSQANVGQAAEKDIELIAPAGGKTGASTSIELAARRAKEETGEWKKEYALRAGIEGLNRALKATTGLGQLRVRGSAAVNMSGYLKVTGWNIRTAVKIQQSRRRKLRKAAQEGRLGENPRRATRIKRHQTQNPPQHRSLRRRLRDFPAHLPQSTFPQSRFCAHVFKGANANAPGHSSASSRACSRGNIPRSFAP